MSVLEVKNLCYTYSEGLPDEKKAVKNVSFTAERGEFIGIIGHTGSGKSTLIQMLNGLLKPHSGQVLIDGQDLWADKSKLRENRFRVGLVLQYPEYQLFEETVRKDIAFGPRNMGLSEEEIEARVQEAAAYLGLSDELLSRSPFDLSGGEKRRAAIAGVLAMRPEVLVLDEPTAGLDPRGRRELLQVVQDYHKKANNTVIFISHSMDDVARYSDRVLVMNAGEVFCFEAADEVFRHAAKLREMGLNIPAVTEMMLQLRDKGHALNTAVYTAQAAADAVAEKLKGGDAQ